MFLLSGLLCGLVLKRACCFDFRSQGIGSVVEYVLTHVEDMLAGGYSCVCWSGDLQESLSWAASNNTSNSSSHRRTIAASTSDAAGGALLVFISFGSEGSTSRARATLSSLDKSGNVLMSFRFVGGVLIVPARSPDAGLRKRSQKTSSGDAAMFRNAVVKNVQTIDLLLDGELATEESDLFVGPLLQVPSRKTTTWCWLQGARVCVCGIRGGRVFCSADASCIAKLFCQSRNRTSLIKALKTMRPLPSEDHSSSRTCPCNCLRPSVSVEMSSASGWQTSCRVTAIPRATIWASRSRCRSSASKCPAA